MAGDDETKKIGQQQIDESYCTDDNRDGGDDSISSDDSSVVVEESGGDLMFPSGDGVLRWLSALDFQVMGACRADERLKPLLKVNKVNISSGAAEDRLLSQLSQHFEPSEVGLLARCLCMPLVSVRVGKISKQGTLLIPTSIRGSLCLTLLPTSDLRLLFNGDDGSIERVATLSTEVLCTSIEIEDMCADKSGRSFSIKTSGGNISYYWCSEKSKLLGNELLGKMKDLLARRPSLAELTGISDSRLNCFATHLRAYLAGSTSTGVTEATVFSDELTDSSELSFPQSSSIVKDGSGLKSNLFEVGTSEYFFPMKSAAATEKSRLYQELYTSSSDNVAPASSNCIDPFTSNSFQKYEFPEVIGANPFAVSKFSGVLGKSLELPEIQVSSSGSSEFSPQYCWCPPVALAMQYTLDNSQLPMPLSSSSTLPPLSSLLSATKPSSLLSISDLPQLEFPSLLPEPLARLPTSQQISTFTPLICDPIVHIPVIDVCSSGQGYLVSAGPSITTTIPNLADPLLSNAESMIVEQGARETLRMLISSSNQPKPRLLEVLPSVFNSNDDMQTIGSRGIYSGTSVLDASPNIMTSMGFFLAEKHEESGIGERCCSSGDEASDVKENPCTSGMHDSDAGQG